MGLDSWSGFWRESSRYGRSVGAGCTLLAADHPANRAERLHVNVPQLAAIIRAHVERKDVAVLDRAEVVRIDLLSRMDELVVLRQRIEPHRPALVRRQNRIRKLGQPVTSR